MKSLLCKLLGHDFSIFSVRGRFVWCKRCAMRKDNPSWHNIEAMG